MGNETKPAAKRIPGTGIFEALLCGCLLYGVYDQTPLGAAGELVVRKSLGQEFTPSWFATFRGKEVQLNTHELERFGHIVETSERSSVVETISQQTKVNPEYLDALISVHGQCISETNCTMTTPAHLPQLLDRYDLPQNVQLAEVARGIGLLKGRLPQPSSASALISSLYIGPVMTQQAIRQATRSGLDAPSDIETFSSFLPPGLRRGNLQQAAKVLAFYRMRKMTWPVKTSFRVTSPYGMRIHPVTKRKKFHNGIDLATPVGTELYAPYAGKISRIGSDSISGTYVKIDRLRKVPNAKNCHLK